MSVEVVEDLSVLDVVRMFVPNVDITDEKYACYLGSDREDFRFVVDGGFFCDK